MSTPDPHPPWTTAAIDAVTEAAEHERDFGGWLSLVLTYAAARKGSIDALTAGRPGSWEAADVDHLARGLVSGDEGLAWYAEDDRKRRYDVGVRVTVLAGDLRVLLDVWAAGHDTGDYADLGDRLVRLHAAVDPQEDGDRG